jgi:hypothetical protein
VASGAPELAAGIRIGMTDREQLLDELRPASFAIANPDKLTHLGPVADSRSLLRTAR